MTRSPAPDSSSPQRPFRRLRRNLIPLLDWLRLHSGHLHMLWDGFSIGVLGLNSFILLYYRYGQHNGMDYVIISGAVGYAAILFAQSIWLRAKPSKRHKTAHRIKSVFRLIYTAMYLTAIMLEVIEISAAKAPGYEQHLIFYGIVFLGVGLWGTNCLWLGKVLTRFLKHWKKGTIFTKNV